MVVLLNPNFSSITKVWYAVKGILIISDANITTPAKISPVNILLNPNPLAKLSMQLNPPARINIRTMTRLNESAIKSKLVFSLR